MTSVNELFPRCQKLRYDLQQQLREVEANRMSYHDMQLGLDALAQQVSATEGIQRARIESGGEVRSPPAAPFITSIALS